MSASTENKNALNVPDDTKSQVFQRVGEKVIVEEGSTVIERNTHGNSFILGSSVNGKLGVVNLGENGVQIVLGEAGRIRSSLAVVALNNIHREHFRDLSFQDSSEVNTADWDTANGRLAMSTSNNHMVVYNAVAHSSEVALNDGTVTSVTVNAEETKYGSDTIQYFVSADGGSDYTEVTSLGVSTALNTSGVDVRWKIIMIGNGGSDTYITNLRITYG